MLSAHMLRHDRRWLMLLAVWLAAWVLTIEAGQTGATLQALEVGRPLVGEISGDKSVSYRVTANAGDYLRIVLNPRGVNVSATLWRPNATVLLDVHSTQDEFIPETIVAVVDVSGEFRVDVRAAVKTSPPGRYQVVLEALHPATADDLVRVDAERAFERARTIQAGEVISDYPKAIAEYKTARELYRRTGDKAGELKSILGQALTECSVAPSDADETIALGERLATEIHDDLMRALALDLRGLMLDRAGNQAGALRAYEESLAIYEAIGHTSAAAMTLNGIGLVYGKSGDSDRALARFERGLAIADEFHNERLRQIFLNNIGIAYKNVGEYDKALAAYQQVLSVPNLRREVRSLALNNAGNVQRLLGHYREALALHVEALEIARAIGSKDSEARSLNTIGQTYFSLGDYQTALKNEEESLAIRRTLGDLPGQASALDAMGQALQQLGNRDGAYTSLTEALSIRRSIRDQYGEPGTLQHLATIDRDRGDLPLALEHIKAAVDLEEELRARITSPELRATFVAAQFDKYSLYIDLLQQQDARDPGKGHAAEALHVNERARARVLLESLLDARVDLRQGIDPALLERERALQKQLSGVSMQISRSLGTRKDPPASLVQKYEQLTGEYQKHLALIRQQSPHYAAVTQPRPLSVTEIQQTVVDADTVLLEFELGTERSWLWAVTSTELISVALPPRDEIDAATRALYENLTSRQRRPGDTTTEYGRRVSAADAGRDAKATAVSRMLFGGIADRLQGAWRGKRLAIVAAGSLEYVPFGALPMPNGTRTLLTTRHEIVKIPSASVLAGLRSEADRRTPAPRALAIVADPVFEVSDPRVVSPSTPMSSRVSDIDESVYVRAGLSRLPFSRDEANAIAALVPPKDVFKATDFDATRATALDGKLAGHRIVHLATHGVLDSERPSLSGLVLSLVDERGQRQNGFVRLHDIYNMRLDADLVVLSACQTALGKNIRGEGLIGLTRAFMYAGTPRVIASLWEVNDLATAELMKKFYTGMLQRHLRPAAALRAAQLEMSKDPRWAAPYYWAGFVFQGDWK